MQTALSKAPQEMAINMPALVAEYEAQDTPEARFTKAIDKIEPTFEVFDKYGKQIIQENKTSYDDHMRIKIPYIKDYPYIMRYNAVITQEMGNQGYFYDINSA
jgi:5'-deoxynucleotidase YfbR-like HD superfamily hydrolase